MRDADSDAVWHSRFEWNAQGQAHGPAQSATWDRLALALCAAEPQQRDVWQQRFRGLLEEHCFLPSRQLLHAAGIQPHASLSSCFAVNLPADSLHGVFDALHDSVVCLHAGADVGVDLSTVLPAQWAGFGDDPDCPGPGPFANLWSVACDLLGQGNGHPAKVAMTLRCDHPDIARFVAALPVRGADPHIEAAVLVSDAFLEALDQDADWPLLFPLQGGSVPPGRRVVERIWPGHAEPQVCLVHGSIRAQTLWVRLLQAQHTFGAPRLLFADTLQRGHSLWYLQQLHTANPGGSMALARDAGCIGGSINLAYMLRPGTHPDVAWDRLQAAAALAVRFLDNAHSLAEYPQPRLARNAHATRCIGLGVTGLASLLQALGLDYGSPSSLELTHQVMATIRDAAFHMSIALAREKGAFPAFDPKRYPCAALVLDLPHALQDAIARHGLRNGQLLAVGTDVLLDRLSGTVSHGIEPLMGPGCAAVPPAQQLALASVVQRCVDNGVSVNLHVPHDTPARALDALLREAWTLRLKNVLVQRSS